MQTNTLTDTLVESMPAVAPVSAPNIARGLVPSPPPFPPTRPPKLPITSTNHPEVVSSNSGSFQPLEKSVTPQQFEGRNEETTEEERQDSENMPKGVLPVDTTTATTPLLFRTSTPTQNLAGSSEELNLTQLETGFTIASSSRTVLPELLSVVYPAVEVSTPSFLRPEIDDGSSSAMSLGCQLEKPRLDALMTALGPKKLVILLVKPVDLPCMDLSQLEPHLKEWEKNRQRRHLTTFLTLYTLLPQLHTILLFQNSLAEAEPY